MQREWKWWLYCAVLCSAAFGRMIERLLRDSGGFWSQFGPPIAATIVCVGIIAWLRNKGIFNVWAWRAIHLGLALAQIAGLAFASYLATNALYVPAGLILASCFILGPAFYALFLYSYRSPGIWK